MNIKSKTFKYFTIALVLHALLFIYKNYVVTGVDPGSLQQENFIIYVDSLKSGNFPEDLTYWDTRYFPGLPLMIYTLNFITHNSIVSGLLISIIGISATYFLVNKITKNSFYALILTLFPPIVFEQTSKISTEVVIIPLTLFAYYYAFSRDKNYGISALFSGLSVLARPISLVSYVALVLHIYKNELKHKWKKILKTLPYFSVFLFLFVYNFFIFDGEILYQLKVYGSAVGLSSSLSAIIKDVNIEIGQNHWRIIISALTYIIFSSLLIIMTLKKKGDFIFNNDAFYIKSWSVLTIWFIFSYGPSQFLGDSRRFLSIFFPLILAANHKSFSQSKIFICLSLLATISSFV